MHVIGGVDIDNDNKRLSTVRRYIPDANVWQEVARLRNPSSSLCAVADEKNIYAIGGINSLGLLVSDVEKFDLEGNCWKWVAPTHAQRKSPAGVNFHDKIFVFGGLDNNPHGCSCEIMTRAGVSGVICRAQLTHDFYF